MTEPLYLSTAKLSGIALELACERAVLAAFLRGLGPLSLAEEAADGGDGAEHTVYCELWDVHDGALWLGDTDQHTLAARTGELAASVSRAFARTFGAYRESFVWVPGVRLGRAEPASFVIGMLTDSRLARFADHAWGFGYDKRLGRFERSLNDAWTVYGPSGRTELCFVPSAAAAKTLARSRLASFEQRIAAPLLGLTRSGGFVRSVLQRSLTGAASVRALGGELSLSERFVPGGRARYTFSAAPGKRAPRALAFTDMPVRVSVPRPSS